MVEKEEVAALVVDNGSGMCKAGFAGHPPTADASPGGTMLPNVPREDSPTLAPAPAPAPALRGQPPPGARLEFRQHLGESLVAARDFQLGELVLREKMLLMAPPDLPPLGMFAPVPLEAMSVEMEGEGFPGVCTFSNMHLRLLFAYVNADRAVQADVLAMQDHMAIGSESRRSIDKAARWLADLGLPWLLGLGALELSRLLRIFCVNSFPCKAVGSTCCILKWGTMIVNSCRPNVFYRSVEVDGDYEGRFYALQHIAKDELFGSTYMRHCGLLASLAERRRVLWFLKGFLCTCARCCAEAVHGDEARVLRCNSCAEPCALVWQYRACAGNYGFVGSHCGLPAGDAAVQQERRLSTLAMRALFEGRFADIPAEVLLRLREQSEELPWDHWARRGLQAIGLCTEGRELCKQRRHGSVAIAGAVARWLREVWEWDSWLRATRGEPHGLLAFDLAPMVRELASQAGTEAWSLELQGRAREAGVIDHVYEAAVEAEAEARDD